MRHRKRNLMKPPENIQLTRSWSSCKMHHKYSLRKMFSESETNLCKRWIKYRNSKSLMQGEKKRKKKKRLSRQNLAGFSFLELSVNLWHWSNTIPPSFLSHHYHRKFVWTQGLNYNHSCQVFEAYYTMPKVMLCIKWNRNCSFWLVIALPKKTTVNSLLGILPN